jgi:hypothetical protein
LLCRTFVHHCCDSEMGEFGSHEILQ